MHTSPTTSTAPTDSHRRISTNWNQPDANGSQPILTTYQHHTTKQFIAELLVPASHPLYAAPGYLHLRATNPHRYSAKRLEAFTAQILTDLPSLTAGSKALQLAFTPA